MKLTTLLCAAALSAVAPAFAADNYPNKPVRVVVGFPPGQATDETARRLMLELGPRMQQSFVVENRPGGGAGIAAEMVARSTPDGYTLLASSSGPLTINGWVYKDLRYDVKRDFEPVAPISISSLALVVRADAPYRSVDDLVKDAKERPGRLNYGSGGQGVTNHLAMEMLKQTAHIDMVHVPYKGGVAAMTDLVGGQIDAMFEVVSIAQPLIEQGRLRALAVSGGKRSSMLPDVPTLKEMGYDVQAEPWAGILAPAGTPAAVLAQLHRQIADISDSTEWRDYTHSRGADVLIMSREEFRDFIQRDIERWGLTVKRAGIQPQ